MTIGSFSAMMVLVAYATNKNDVKDILFFYKKLLFLTLCNNVKMND
jgi:hypothetical protein